MTSSKFHKYKNYLIGLFFAGILLILLGSSSLHQKLGNLFFGTPKFLYNVTLANFFFGLSSYPLFGKAEPYAHYQLSRTYFIQGHVSEAIVEAENELSLYPEHTRTYYILGLAYGYSNQEEKAIQSFKKFIEWKPTTWAARNDAAWLQFRMGDIDGALATIEPVSEQKNNPWIQNTLGVLLMNKKRFSEAKVAFENAEKITNEMTEENWGAAYPGNDPRVYSQGLLGMKSSIASNLKLLDVKMKKRI